MNQQRLNELEKRIQVLESRSKSLEEILRLLHEEFKRLHVATEDNLKSIEALAGLAGLDLPQMAPGKAEVN